MLKPMACNPSDSAVPVQSDDYACASLIVTYVIY